MQAHFVPCALALLAAPSSAQLLYDGQATHEIQLPPEWGTSSNPVTKSLAGDIHGDGYNELVLLAGTTLSAGFGAGYHTAWAELTASDEDVPASTSVGTLIAVTDFDLVPGAGTNGGDAIAYVNADGLHLAVYDSDYDASAPHQNFTSSRVEAGPWLGAQRVVIGDFDGNGTLGAIGIDATGDDLLLKPDLTGQTQSVQIAPGAASVLSLASFDYDGDGDQDPTVITTQGALILSGATWPPLFSLPLPLTAACLASLQQDATTERMAAVLRVASGMETLYVLDSTGYETLLLGLSDTQGIATGDIDADGADDLALAHRTDHTGQPHLMHHGVTIFPNNGPGQTFGTTAEEVDMGVGPFDPGSDQRTGPVLADLARDGDLDLALPTTIDGKAHIQFNSFVNDHRRQQPTFYIGDGRQYADGTFWVGFTFDFENELSGFEGIEVVQWAGSYDAEDSGFLLAPDGIDVKEYAAVPFEGKLSALVQVQQPGFSNVLHLDERRRRGCPSGSRRS